MSGRSHGLIAYGSAVGLPTLLTIALVPLASGDQATNVAFAYLIAVVVAALLGGVGAGLLASVYSFVLLNYFFIEPVHTLSVTARRDVGVLVGFAFTAFVVSSLLEGIERRRRETEAQAQDLALLYDVSLAFSSDGDTANELAELAALAQVRIGFRVVAVVRRRGPDLELLHDGGASPAEVLRDAALPAPTPMVAGASVGGSTEEVLLLGYPGEATFDDRTRRMLEALAAQAAAALRRADQEVARRDLAVLQRTDQQRVAIVSAVSHDLRTPLAAIGVSASALEHSLRDDEERRELASAISAHAARLDRMVANLLDLGRIEGGVLRADREPVPVEELVGAVLNVVRPRLGGRDLVVDVPEPLPAVLIDPVQVGQSLTNLVDNALEHTPESASISVSASAAGNYVTVRVADSGGGIPEGYRSVIFDRFGRAPGSGGGSGLGLAIARAYAEASGGTLTLGGSSRAGTAFDLMLPVAGPA